MEPASRARPSRAPEREMFSDPAKSTRLSFPTFTTSSPSGVVSFMWMVTLKTECERDERLLRSVSAVRRFAVPLSKTA
jgi:hypothetical protein